MKKIRQQATILDLARLSGLSKSTVSRVMTGAPNISEKAQKKVAEAVEATGYRPNDVARSLRSGSTGNVGMLIPDISNPFWAEVVRGAQDAAAKTQTAVIVFNSDWNAEREDLHLRALIQSRVDGVIVNPVHDGLDEIAHFQLPTVLIGSSATRFPDLTSVTSDIEQGVEIALDRLYQSNLGMPAFLVGGAKRSARGRFVAAVEKWAVQRGVDCSDLKILDGKYSIEGGCAAAHALLGGADRPRAIFAASDLMALGALQALRQLDLSCPNDVAVLGFDGIAAGEVTSPPLSTVSKPSRRIGEEAFRLLMKSIDGEQGAHLTLPCRLREGGTLPSLKNIRSAMVG